MSTLRLFASQSLRNILSGWTGGFSTYAYGLFTSYLLFSTLFGKLYSLAGLASLAIQSVTFPLALITLLIEVYLISFFAIPVGMAYRILWEGRLNLGVRSATVGIILLAGLLSLRSDAGTILSVILFSVILVWFMWRESYVWGERRHRPLSFLRALAILYCVFMAVLYIAYAQTFPLSNYSTASQLLFSFVPSVLLPIQALSLLFTAISAPIIWVLGTKQRPRTIWFILVGFALLSITTISQRFYVPGALVIGMTLLLFYRYNTETAESFGETSVQSLNSMTQLSRAGDPLSDISLTLKKIAAEAEFLREERTGEILRVKRHEPFTLRLDRIATIEGKAKSIGINHFLISSRTGHGKTTLVRNLANLNQNYGFLIMDRHDEYEGHIFQFDKEFQLEKFEGLLRQIPSSQLSSGPNMLREAQLYNVEQQFERALQETLNEEYVSQFFSRLSKGERIVLRPGSFPDLIYTRLCHRLIDEVFTRWKKMQKGAPARLRICVVNEEAQNSFSVDEQGEEKDRNHPLLRIVHEGRKYGFGIINITSNPEDVPRTVKDNSILILGSIGTPAIKRLVGEKLGMIYVRYIYELPIGDFFLDLVDENGDYGVFPNHFGNREFVDAIKS